MQLELDNMFIPQNKTELENICKKVAYRGIKILEIGSWKGNSTSIMAAALKDYDPEIFCVDTWQGSEGEPDMLEEAKRVSIFSIFRNNLELLGLYKYIKPLMMDSREAFKILPDEYFDLIFVDGNHTYDFSYGDITNYLPKLKKGGIICGDDCEEYFSNLPGDVVEQNKNNDWTIINGKGYHCGVITALYELFNDDYYLKDNGSTFWWKEIKDPKMISAPSDMLLVYGYQVNENSALLMNEADKGTQIVALDVSAASKLKELRINHILFDLIVKEEGLAEIFEKSRRLSLSWFHLLNEYVTYKDLNLAELDFEAMRWYWFQAAAVLKLCEIQKGSIRVLPVDKSCHSLYYYKNDSLKYLLSRCGKLNLSDDDNASRQISAVSADNNPDYSQFSGIKDKYVFILHPGEFYRYIYILELLYSEYKNNFCVVLLFPDKKVFDEIKARFPIDVFQFNNRKSGRGNLFNEALQRLNDNRNNPVIKEVASAVDQLKYLFEERWPVLLDMIDGWESVLAFRPAAVIGSNLPDAESQIPMVICSKLNIPVISIPHGINTYRPFYSNNKNLSCFFSFRNETESYISEGYSENNLYLVNELELKYEYKTSKSAKYFNGRHKILVLMYPAGIDGMLFRYSSVVKQIEGIESLIELQKSDSSYDIKFKLHPGFHDKELFDLVYEDEDLKSFILPLDSDLYDCLDEADLVISINSINAAAVHSIRMKKPLLFYWNNLLYKSREKVTGAYDLFSSMPVAENKEDIVKYIHYFFNDRETVYKMESSSENMRSFLEGREYRISFIDAVETVVHGKKQIKKLKPLNNNVQVSVIVPTYNRASSLIKLLESIYNYNQHNTPEFEVIIVDNGSSDNTKEIAESFLAKYDNVKYIYEPEPGLLSGRHAGAAAAKGEILTFVDDDIEITGTWLEGIREAFENPEVHLAGGPSIPIYEGNYPEWMLYYFKDHDSNKECGYLSLLNMSGGSQFINPVYIWGLNMSVRKSTLYKVGGFNPDTISKTYQYLQGDGETGLSYKIMEAGLKAFYSEKIKVYHNVYMTRMTLQYFKERSFFQGVCDSYTKFRKVRDLSRIEISKPFNKAIPPALLKYQQYYHDVQRYYMYGFLYHQFALRKSDELLDWVLKKDYWEYKLPKLSEKFHKEMQILRENLQLLDGSFTEELQYAH